jgi:hypothetical protein
MAAPNSVDSDEEEIQRSFLLFTRRLLMTLALCALACFISTRTGRLVLIASKPTRYAKPG